MSEVVQLEVPGVDHRSGTQANGHVMYGSLTPVGWEPPKDHALTFDQWEQTGHVITTLYNSVKFARGDWLLYGEGEYGERFAQAVATTGLDPDVLRHEAWVSSSVESGFRNPDLSWTHHRYVAPLPSAGQEQWLAIAVEEQIGANDLRDRISRKRIEDSGGPTVADVHGFLSRATHDLLMYINSARELGGMPRMVQALSEGDRKGYADEIEDALGTLQREWVAELRRE